MKQPTAEQKHCILTHCAARRAGETLQQILALHDIAASRQAVSKWRQHWDGTLASLQRKQGSGRHRVLSKAQVTRHVVSPIRNANRAARPVRYTKLLAQVQAATHSQVSLRTLQRYGHDEAGGRKTRGKKRTAAECKCKDAAEMCGALVVRTHYHSLRTCCLSTISSVGGYV